MSRFKKNEPYVWHTQQRPSESKPCVCCTQTLPPERSESPGYEPKWHFAPPSTGGLLPRQAAPPAVWQKKCRLSVTQVRLFWWNGQTRIICQKRIMSTQMFRRSTKSARCVTILPMPWHATPSRDLGGVPPFHKKNDLATYCWSSSIAWDSKEEQRS